jgi:hypothetical protein
MVDPRRSRLWPRRVPDPVTTIAFNLDDYHATNNPLGVERTNATVLDAEGTRPRRLLRRSLGERWLLDPGFINAYLGVAAAANNLSVFARIPKKQALIALVAEVHREIAEREGGNQDAGTA